MQNLHALFTQGINLYIECVRSCTVYKDIYDDYLSGAVLCDVCSSLYGLCLCQCVLIEVNFLKILKS